MIISYDEKNTELKALEITDNKFPFQEDIVVTDMRNEYINGTKIYQFTYKGKIHFVYINNSGSEKQFNVPISDIDIIKDKEFKGGWGSILEEVEVSSYSKYKYTSEVDATDLIIPNYEELKKRFELVKNKNIREKLLLVLEQDKEKIKNEKYESHLSVRFSRNFYLMTENKIFDIKKGKIIEDSLFMLGDVEVKRNGIKFFNGLQKNFTEDFDFLFDFYNKEKWEELSLRDLDNITFIYKQLDEDTYLGFDNNQYKDKDEFEAMFSRKEKNDFNHSNYKIKYEENKDYIIVSEYDTYEEEYKPIYKKSNNPNITTQRIGNKIYEYENKILSKVINEWHSLLYDFVLLDNGQLWAYRKDNNEDVEEDILLEENCNKMFLIRDWNDETTIIRTNNNTHYFPRFQNYSEIDFDKIDKYRVSEKITDDLKDNDFIKVYIDKPKFTKTTQIYNIKFLSPLKVNIDDNDKGVLENKSEYYFLYDALKGEALFKIGEKQIIVKLPQENLNTKNYEGTIIFASKKFKRFPGMEKITFKKGTNYLLFKSKGKKRVYIYQKFIDKINSQEHFVEKSVIDFYDGNELSGEGFSYFNDKNLPDYIFCEDKFLKSIKWIEKNKQYEETKIEYDKYGKITISKKKGDENEISN